MNENIYGKFSLKLRLCLKNMELHRILKGKNGIWKCLKCEKTLKKKLMEYFTKNNKYNKNDFLGMKTGDSTL